MIYIYPDAFELDSNPGKEIAKQCHPSIKSGILIPANIKQNPVILLRIQNICFKKLILRGTAYEQINSQYG